jgi:hypothetical protein
VPPSLEAGDDGLGEGLAVGVVAGTDVDRLALCAAELLTDRLREHRSLEVVGRRNAVEQSVVLNGVSSVLVDAGEI